MPDDEKDPNRLTREYDERGLRTVSVDELNGFQVDRHGNLYWRGKKLLTEEVSGV